YSAFISLLYHIFSMRTSSQKAGGVKGQSPCCRPHTAKLHRGAGTESLPFNTSKKFFGKLFSKKAWAAESRLMKFPVNKNNSSNSH
ncbi:MAG: hypothetical protein ACI4JM_10785, partial [Oscillospiraceae bacterium]